MMKRRAYLATVGTGALFGTAGCAGILGNPPDPEVIDLYAGPSYPERTEDGNGERLRVTVENDGGSGDVKVVVDSDRHGDEPGESISKTLPMEAGETRLFRFFYRFPYSTYNLEAEASPA